MNSADREGRTPLHHAAMTGNSLLCKFLLAVGGQHKGGIDRMLSQKDKFGRTPLQLSQAAKKPDAVSTLELAAAHRNYQAIHKDVISYLLALSEIDPDGAGGPSSAARAHPPISQVVSPAPSPLPPGSSRPLLKRGITISGAGAGPIVWFVGKGRSRLLKCAYKYT